MTQSQRELSSAFWWKPRSSNWYHCMLSGRFIRCRRSLSRRSKLRNDVSRSLNPSNENSFHRCMSVDTYPSASSVGESCLYCDERGRSERYGTTLSILHVSCAKSQPCSSDGQDARSMRSCAYSRTCRATYVAGTVCTALDDASRSGDSILG